MYKNGPEPMKKTVIILGARGRFGRAAASAFTADGWTVTRLVRPGKGGSPGTVEADATDADSLARACGGQAVIVNALNPPYHRWKAEMPRLTRAVIAAARSSGATVLIPGNVYNYGENLPERLSSDTPQAATGKGGLRITMETAFRDAGVPTIILRGGDFIEGEATGNWFDGIITAKVAKGRVAYPGPRDRVHAWAYLPDMARAAVELVSIRGSLPKFADIPFPGYALTGDELCALIDKATGRELRRTGVPWLAIRALGLVNPLMREVAAMRYLWQRPHRLDGSELAALLPGFRPTPPDVAITAALAGLGQIAPAVHSPRARPATA